MPDVHALLSASSSKQWLHCPPSVRLQEGFPNESSVYAAEGTFAHDICEYKVRKYMHERVKRPQSEEFDTEEIEQITDMYAEFVISIVEKMEENGCEPLTFVEERVNYTTSLHPASVLRICLSSARTKTVRDCSMYVILRQARAYLWMQTTTAR